MKCDHTVAYNGDSPLRDIYVCQSELQNYVADERKELKEWLAESMDESNSKELKELSERGTDREILARNYDISEYCPKCGVRVEWGNL